MGTLDDYFNGVVTQDTRTRVQTHGDLVQFIGDPHSSLTCEDLDKFIDGLTGWVNSSNYKISVNGLEVLCLMVDRMGEEFKPHVSTVLPACIDRLGDAKEQVRDQAQQLLLKLMLPASSPQYVFERMMPAFSHKLWHVREGCLICLSATINRYGARSLQLSKIVPSICKMLEDQSGQVREEAINTLTEIYRHVGERVRVDLSRKTIPPQRLKQLFARFDEVKLSGNMLPTADLAPSRGSSSACNSDDETDFAKPMSTKVYKTNKLPTTSAGTKPRKPLVASRINSASSSSGAGGAGAMDEDLFIKSFEDVPKVKIFSSRDVQEQLNNAQAVLSNPNADWEKRIEVLKSVRSLVLHGAVDYDDFYPSLRSLESSFMSALKDLRSQVVREACLTVAYLAQQLGHKFDHFSESVFPMLFQLVPNTAKVMATSGVVCIRFIVQYVHTPRLIPQITGNLTSKSNIIRRYSCELLNQLLHTWHTHTLERHIALLQDAIKRGISDADSEARSFSRKAFWGFADHFKDQADALLNSLDSSKQKLLQGEISGSSSSNSINSNDNNKAGRTRTRSASQDRTFESSTLTRNSGARRSARYSSSKSDAGGDLEELAQGYEETLRVDKTFRDMTSARGITRSSSAVDLAPSTRISPRPRTSLLAASRLTPGSTNSLPRQKSSSASNKPVKSLIAPSPNRSRNKTRMGMSQSQPGSRSSSPSSRLNYLTHTTAPRTETLTPNRTRKSMPRSQGASREASPNRSTYGRERRLSGSKIGSGGKGGLMSHRLLRHTSELEDSIADALRTPNRKTYNYDSDDNASETSSVCSERSYTSYSGRTSESSDTERIHQLSSSKRKDMQEILACMGSGSYTERKEGLISLQLQLRAHRYLSRSELKKVTEIFTRMFHDPHSKVFSIFMDTLVYLISLHHQDLLDWLFVLLSRLLMKTGSEMLGSVSARLQKALDMVRCSFPYSNQFSTVTKFITDQFLNQSPNLKIKISVLNYLNALANQMDSSALVNSTESRVAVSKIISWTTEPHVEVRKSAQSVLIALFNCNSAEFSLILSAIPKPFQDGATKILHNHIRSASSGGTSDVLSQRNVASLPHNTSQQRSRPPSRSSLGHPDDNETENLNPEDIYNSIKKTTADIHNLSINSKLDHYEDIKKKREFTSQDSGIQDLRNDSPDAVDGKRLHYNPTHYQENLLNGKHTKQESAMFDADELFNESLPANQGELIIEILTELSNHNTRNDERKTAMYSLTQLTRKGDFKHWDEHFKNILLILLETLGDDDAMIRAFSLRVLKEILQKEAPRFEEYAELTIFRILEAHKDSAKDVTKAAEECANTMARCMPTEQTMRILKSIIDSSKFPVNMAAIKMQAKVIELFDKQKLLDCLELITPGLLKACEDADSHVRKAAVFALVACYQRVGEDLRPHLASLSSSKMKLLNLYIKRNQSQKDGARSLASPNFSDT